MPEVIIKKNSGTKFLVMLAGHDRSLGQIECIVSLPVGVKARSTEQALRRLAIAQAAQLAQQLHKALTTAGVACLDDQRCKPDDAEELRSAIEQHH